jgi:hypothetical protein
MSKATFKNELIKSYLQQAKSSVILNDYQKASQVYKRILVILKDDEQATEGLQRCDVLLDRERKKVLYSKGLFREAELA